MKTIEITDVQFEKLKNAAAKNGVDLQTLLSQITNDIDSIARRTTFFAKYGMDKGVNNKMPASFLNYIKTQRRYSQSDYPYKKVSMIDDLFFSNNLREKCQFINKALHSSFEEWGEFCKSTIKDEKINYALTRINAISGEYEKVLLQNRDEDFAFKYFLNLFQPSSNMEVFADKFSKKVWNELWKRPSLYSEGNDNIEALKNWIVKETLENGNAKYCKEYMLKMFATVNLTTINIDVDNLFKLPETMFNCLMKNPTLSDEIKEKVFDKFGIIPKDCISRIQNVLYETATKEYLDVDLSLRDTKTGKEAKSMLNAIMRSSNINECIKNDLLERFCADDNRDIGTYKIYEALLEEKMDKKHFEKIYQIPNLSDKWKKKISMNCYNNTEEKRKYINEKIKTIINDISAIINFEKVIYTGIRDKMLTTESYKLLISKACKTNSITMRMIATAAIHNGNLSNDMLEYINENADDKLKFEVAYVKYCKSKGIDPYYSDKIFDTTHLHRSDLTAENLKANLIQIADIDKYKENFMELQKFASPSCKKELEKEIKYLESLQKGVAYNIDERKQANELFEEVMNTNNLCELAEKIYDITEKYNTLLQKSLEKINDKEKNTEEITR